MRAVEALAAIRSSRFDLPLTYDAGDLELRVGDIVRVPLGSREVVAFVVSPVRDVARDPRVKAVIERCDVPRAFDDEGLHLARFVAERYVCTLGEALSAVVLAAAVPRTVDLLRKAATRANAARYPSVPARLLALIWEQFPEAFALETLLRHPDARRTGDRAMLLRHVQTLTRSGDLSRERRFESPKTRTYTVTVLRPGSGEVRGKKAQLLAAYVREQPGVPRAEALLAGFSNAVIARAVKAQAVIEAREEPARERMAARAPSALQPTPEQAAALARITAWLDAREHREALLYGVTGSGKTYVYVEAIRRVLAAGGRAIVLVPEISLTPQTARRFEDAFGERVAVLHSALSERERFDAWQAAMRGEVDVVVGARSAVFAPLPDVRLIVVDEAHESSYKQETVPRYHAVAVARERMRACGGVAILGSATPSLESWDATQRGSLELLRMDLRATGQALPEVRVIDMGRAVATGERRIFGPELTQALAERLERREKAVLFVNRRGSSRFLLCRSCGQVPECERCSVTLAVHRAEHLLRCHYCDLQRAIPVLCPNCGSGEIAEYGVGTERVAQEVARVFPQARIVRMDSDTTTRVGDHARLLDEFGESGDVLVGTQMVAKGLDFPSVTLVGVVAADVGLHVPDFRAGERSFDLIAQVCGRSGRARPGEAIVQTYAPNHPAIVHAAMHDFDGFADEELRERAGLGYPPARRLIYLGVIGRNRARTMGVATNYATRMAGADVGEVLGPAPYPIARLNEEWRFRIMLKTRNSRAAREAIRREIVPLARADRTTRLAINVDP